MGTIKTHVDSSVSMSLLRLLWFFIPCETFGVLCHFILTSASPRSFVFLYFSQEGKRIGNFVKEQKIELTFAYIFKQAQLFNRVSE